MLKKQLIEDLCSRECFSSVASLVSLGRGATRVLFSCCESGFLSSDEYFRPRECSPFAARVLFFLPGVNLRGESGFTFCERAFLCFFRFRWLAVLYSRLRNDVAIAVFRFASMILFPLQSALWYGIVQLPLPITPS